MTFFTFDTQALTCNNFAPLDEDTLRRCKSNCFTLRMERNAYEEYGYVEIICNVCQHVTRIFP